MWRRRNSTFSWRKEPTIGVFVILKRRFVGLVSASEPNQLARGEAARFRVASILPDGKVELTLRRFVSEEIEGDAARTLAVAIERFRPDLALTPPAVDAIGLVLREPPLSWWGRRVRSSLRLGTRAKAIPTPRGMRKSARFGPHRARSGTGWPPLWGPLENRPWWAAMRSAPWPSAGGGV